jgi:hypothetical protein
MLAKGFVDEVGSHGVSDHKPKHGSVGSIEQVSPGQIETPVVAQQLRHEYAVYELQGLGRPFFMLVHLGFSIPSDSLTRM